VAKLRPGSSGITWYDVLGLLPGATTAQVMRAYEDKVRVLRPQYLAGAPSPVVTAASRAQEILGAARRELADPASRARYDTEAGLRGGNGGLARRDGFPSDPGPEPLGASSFAGSVGEELSGAVLALAGWLGPQPRRPGRVAVPDVRGLSFSVCLEIAGRLGLRVTPVRLTAHPMPVDGLVVGQSPPAPATARPGSALTVQVWHPRA
jgi:PASTA domain